VVATMLMLMLMLMLTATMVQGRLSPTKTASNTARPAGY
jgi:biopolymer transport protein ExbD